MNEINYKVFLLVLFLTFSFKVVQAQNEDKIFLSGSLNLDANNLSNNLPELKAPVIDISNGGKKSRLLAGVLSAVLPGAGEFYAESYLKAGILFTVEVAAIATALIYNRKGDNQTNSFQNYANQDWSIAKYAAWTLQHVNDINAGATIDPKNYKIFGNNVDWTQLGATTNWSQYNGLINRSELNRLETDLGDGYSHQLPAFGEQQYYELIGKYPQYSHGWSTANFGDTDFHTLTQQFLLYAHARGLANSYYTTGSTAIIVIYVNHFLSIFDAIWSVDNFNKSLAINFRVQNGNLADRIDLVPTLNLSYSF
ncbi:MAG: hypothetical protein ACYDA4_07610 [Ignavibacteriaceae bacterium]